MNIKTTLLALSLCTSLTSFAQTDAPDPSSVTIKKITYAGKGCAQGTVQSNVSLDAKAFTLTFSDFYAEVGPFANAGDSSSLCKLKIDIRVPQGWSYTIFSVDYRGYAYLDENVTANVNSKYFFQANPGNYVDFDESFAGLYDDLFNFRNEIAINDVVYSPCGKNRSLNLETTVELDNSADENAEGLFNVDSIDGEFQTEFLIQWLRCE